MLKFGILVALALAAIVPAAPRQARAQSADVSATVDALRDATLAGDLDAIVSLFTPDAVVVSPFGTFGDPAAIRGFYTGFFQQNPGLSITFVDRQVALDTTEVHHSLVASDGIRAAGVERVVFIETIVVVQGKVKSATILLDLSDPQTAQFAAALGGS